MSLSLQNYKEVCISCQGLKALCRARPPEVLAASPVGRLWDGCGFHLCRTETALDSALCRETPQFPGESLNQAHSLDASTSLLKTLLRGHVTLSDNKLMEVILPLCSALLRPTWGTAFRSGAPSIRIFRVSFNHSMNISHITLSLCKLTQGLS